MKQEQNGRQTRPQKGLSKEELVRLIPLAIKGDQAALKKIMTAYTGIVRWKLRQKLHQDANHADIDELTNDVFCKMILGLRSLKVESSFKSWLLGIAQNVAYSYLDELVTHRRMGKLPDKNAELAIDHKLSPEEKDKCFKICQQRSANQHRALIQDIDEERAACAFLSKLDDRLLQQAFMSIPAQYRAVLWKTAVDKLSHDEIAQEHGWSSPAVSRQKLHQAKKAIANLPLPVVIVEIDEDGNTTVCNWDRTPVKNDSPFACFLP